MLKIIEWSERLAFGNKEIDDDHKNLIRYYNEFFTACYSSMGPAVLNVTITKMVEFAKYHFQREEEMMRKEAYPGLVEMKNEHDSLLRTIMELQEKLKTKPADKLSDDTFEFLNNSFITHMMKMDGAFAKFLNEPR